jgi:hypothetical protein
MPIKQALGDRWVGAQARAAAGEAQTHVMLLNLLTHSNPQQTCRTPPLSGRDRSVYDLWNWCAVTAAGKPLSNMLLRQAPYFIPSNMKEHACIC